MSTMPVTSPCTAKERIWIVKQFAVTKSSTCVQHSMTHVFCCKPSNIDELKQVVDNFAKSMDSKLLKKFVPVQERDLIKCARYAVVILNI